MMNFYLWSVVFFLCNNFIYVDNESNELSLTTIPGLLINTVEELVPILSNTPWSELFHLVEDIVNQNPVTVFVRLLQYIIPKFQTIIKSAYVLSLRSLKSIENKFNNSVYMKIVKTIGNFLRAGLKVLRNFFLEASKKGLEFVETTMNDALPNP